MLTYCYKEESYNKNGNMTLKSDPRTVKYLTNKELLAEIARCKKSFCYFISPEYADYHTIVSSLESLTPAYLEEVLAKLNNKLPEGEVAKVKDDLIIRVMTYDHIPLDPDRKRKSRATNQSHARTNFPPFKHYAMINGDWTEVGRSHWEGGIENGHFSIDKGRMSERLGRMFMMLVERYSSRSNWRGYTYRDEMCGLALTHLSQVGLQFDESKSNNPFAFYTTTISHCLSGDTKILTREHGSIEISKVAGQEVTLLDGNGDWIKCPIVDHGIQMTQLNYFQQGGRKEEIWSTMEHGWVGTDGTKITTKDFEGHNVKIADLRPSKEIKDWESYKRGVIHGIIYGDGSKCEARPGFDFKHEFKVRLCGEKAELLSWFTNNEVITYPPSSHGEPNIFLRDTWANLKELPEEPGSDLDYLLGFFRGWVATDGCVAEGAGTPTLCGDVSEHEWMSTWGPLVGWHVNAYTKLDEITNYGQRKKISLNFHLRKSSLIADDFLRSQHRGRWEARRSRSRAKSKGQKYDWAVFEKLKSEGHSSEQIAGMFGAKVTALRSAYSAYKKTRDKKDDLCWDVINVAQPNETRWENVYCPVVPTTGDFALSCFTRSLNCFTRTLNLEKKNQSIRDDLLVNMGMSPSYTRQIADEMAQNGITEPKKIPGKRGRKSAAQIAAEKAIEEKEAKDKLEREREEDH